MFQSLINLITLRFYRLQRDSQKLLQCIEVEGTEEFLELLLRTMGLCLACNPEYRKNIHHFTGRYQFESDDLTLQVSAVFQHNTMTLTDGAIDTPDIVIKFKDPAVLRNFLLAPKQDILDAILKQSIRLDGNLNYLFKFAYMAKRLQLMFSLKV